MPPTRTSNRRFRKMLEPKHQHHRPGFTPVLPRFPIGDTASTSPYVERFSSRYWSAFGVWKVRSDGSLLVWFWLLFGFRLAWFWSCSCLRVCFWLVLWLSARLDRCWMTWSMWFAWFAWIVWLVGFASVLLVGRLACRSYIRTYAVDRFSLSTQQFTFCFHSIARP
jgi:hypothetical protein